MHEYIDINFRTSQTHVHKEREVYTSGLVCEIAGPSEAAALENVPQKFPKPQNKTEIAPLISLLWITRIDQHYYFTKSRK